VISPSGALFYDGSLFPWRDHVIVGGLSARGLIVLPVTGNTVGTEQRIEIGRRIRDVIQARDGSLLVITDEKSGALLKLTPAS
jgi:glucose/arabinose dehydrogenase